MEAKRRIKVRAKAEVKERREDQDPEATHNHRKALEVLGPAQSLESVPGLVKAPLPTLEAISAEIMWLASVPEARTASGLTLLFANITKMDTAKKRGRAANTCTLSAVKPPGSPQKNEVDPWKRLLKQKGLQRKANLGGLKRTKKQK